MATKQFPHHQLQEQLKQSEKETNDSLKELPLSSDTLKEINIKIKLINGDTQNINIAPFLTYKIIDFKPVVFPAEAEKGVLIQLISRGRLLKDDEILQSLQYKDGDYIHATFAQPDTRTVNQENNINNNLNENPGSVPIPMPIIQGNQGGVVNNIINQDLENVHNMNQEQMQRLQGMLHHLIVIQQQQQQLNQMEQLHFQNHALNNGTTCDFILGFVLGYVFDVIGVISVFCCNFTKKAKFGSVIGCLIRLIVSIIYDSYANHTTK